MPILAILLALAAPQPSPGPAQSGVETIAYRCEGGKRLSATWDDTTQQVTLTAGKRSAVLENAVRMSSVDYIGVDGAGVAIRLNGGKDQINALSGFPGGPYFNCQKG